MNFIIILIFIFAGWIAKNRKWLNSNIAQKLNLYVINICIPAIVLINIPKLELTFDLLLPALVPWMIIAVVSIIIIWVGKIVGWSREIVGCLLLFACFGNTSFLGYPIVEAFYGSENVMYAVIYDQFGSFLSLAIVGNIIVASYSEINSKQVNGATTASVELMNNEDKTHQGLKILKTVLFFPPFLTLVFAFMIPKDLIPEDINSLLALVAMTLVPTTMILVGFHLDLRIPTQLKKPLIFGLSAKMILSPIICLILLLLYKANMASVLQDPHLFKVTFMESAMPPMVTTTIMAIHAKLAPKLAAAAVGYGLIFAILTMPIVYIVSNFIFTS